MTKKILKIEFKSDVDEQESPDEDELMTPERRQQFDEGQWWYQYVYARATIEVDNVLQYITSGGLGCVESDADGEYLKEVKEEEYRTLREQLTSLGFTKEEIQKAEVMQ
jgi:hypothetical protein